METQMQTVPEQQPQQRTRAELLAILEELRDVLVRIDDETVDRRYVGFGALAKRLEECMERVEALAVASAAASQPMFSDSLTARPSQDIGTPAQDIGSPADFRIELLISWTGLWVHDIGP